MIHIVRATYRYGVSQK